MVTNYHFLARIAGVPWKEDWANILRNKILTLWADYRSILIDFDSYDGKTGSNHDYVYDPNLILSTPNCDTSERSCSCWQPKSRKRHIPFQERKAVRLAFHDCIPYEDGSGGCDGCLNLDENVRDNNGLQPTVAILVSFV